MVGEGYDAVLAIEGVPLLADVMQRENHAAQARLECYRWAHASGLPTDGGSPALAPKLAAAVDRRRRAATPARPTAVCSTCHMAVPATGVCDNCG